MKLNSGAASCLRTTGRRVLAIALALVVVIGLLVVSLVQAAPPEQGGGIPDPDRSVVTPEPGEGGEGEDGGQIATLELIIRRTRGDGRDQQNVMVGIETAGRPWWKVVMNDDPTTSEVEGPIGVYMATAGTTMQHVELPQDAEAGWLGKMVNIKVAQGPPLLVVEVDTEVQALTPLGFITKWELYGQSRKHELKLDSPEVRGDDVWQVDPTDPQVIWVPWQVARAIWANRGQNIFGERSLDDAAAMLAMRQWLLNEGYAGVLYEAPWPAEYKWLDDYVAAVNTRWEFNQEAQEYLRYYGLDNFIAGYKDTARQVTLVLDQSRLKGFVESGWCRYAGPKEVGWSCYDWDPTSPTNHNLSGGKTGHLSGTFDIVGQTYEEHTLRPELIAHPDLYPADWSCSAYWTQWQPKRTSGEGPFGSAYVVIPKPAEDIKPIDLVLRRIKPEPKPPIVNIIALGGDLGGCKAPGQ